MKRALGSPWSGWARLRLARLAIISLAACTAAAASACGTDTPAGPGAGDAEAPDAPRAEDATASDGAADRQAPDVGADTGAPGDAAAEASADAGADTGVADATTDADAATEAGPLDAAVEAGPPDAGPPVVRYIGRFDTTPVDGPRAAYAASRAVVRFDGTELAVTLQHANGFGGGPSYFDVWLDGALEPAPLVASTGVSTQTVVSGLAAGPHTVELVKRTEGNYGTVQFRGFSYPGGGRLLPPPPPRTRTIEIMGNSVINGYGILGAGPVCTPNAGNQNTEKSAPPITAAALSADLVFLGVSGKGISKNYQAGDPDTLPVIFGRTLPQANTPAWDHARITPDAFVLFATGLDAEVADGVMRPAYLAFVGTVRATYPNAHIFVVVPSTATDNYPVGQMARTRLTSMSNYVVAQRAALGDTKVYAYTMTEYVNGQITACDYHPSEALQTQMATQLTGWIRARLGW